MNNKKPPRGHEWIESYKCKSISANLLPVLWAVLQYIDLLPSTAAQLKIQAPVQITTPQKNTLLTQRSPFSVFATFLSCDLSFSFFSIQSLITQMPKNDVSRLTSPSTRKQSQLQNWASYWTQQKPPTWWVGGLRNWRSQWTTRNLLEDMNG